MRPQAAAFHANLAEVHRRLAQVRAVGPNCCRTASASSPSIPRRPTTSAWPSRHSADTRKPSKRILRTADAARLAWPQQPGGRASRPGPRRGGPRGLRAAVALDPNLPIGRANLGQALVDRGEVDEGLPHCLEAVRLQPDLAAAHNASGMPTPHSKRSEAIAAYAEALDCLPNWAGPRSSQYGTGLAARGPVRQGDLHSAEPPDGPKDAGLWLHLANAHLADEDHVSAIPCCGVQSRSGGGPVRARRPGLGIDGGRPLAEAADCFHRALELDPEFVEAMVKQGGLHEELGEMEQAATATAGPAPPGRPAAPGLPGDLAPWSPIGPRAAGDPHPARGADRGRTARQPALRPGSRLRARGEHAEAAASLEQANALVHACTTSRTDSTSLSNMPVRRSADPGVRGRRSPPRRCWREPARRSSSSAAPFGDHARRAGAVQPFAGPWGRRVAAGPQELRVHPGGRRQGRRIVCSAWRPSTPQVCDESPTAPR